MKDKIKISCLPVSSIKNPYQFLMIEGLRKDAHLTAENGIDDRFFGIIRTAVSQRPDYIHFDWITSYYQRRSLWMTLINIPVLLLQVYLVRFIFGCRLVWTVHNITPHDSKFSQIHRFCRRLFARNMKWIRLFSELSVERAGKELRCNINKFIVISEGSYVEFYTNNVTRTEARNRLNIPDDKMVLLFTGFIKPYKGLEELMECFKESFDSNAVLLIAGQVMDVDYFKKIKESKDDNIVLIDRFIEDDELQFYFNAADVVTLPFKRIENSGSAILAMGFKRPVIAPRMGVLVERLKNQPELLFKESLRESFEVLKKMCPEKLMEIGEKNFEELTKYKWEDFAVAF